MISALLFAIVLAAAPAPQIDPAAQLAVARQLYLSAAYEDALDRLRRIGTAGPLADQVDTYRALCLLALGRSDESARVLEQVVARNPSFSLDEGQVSPRLVAIFQDVRARILPLSARTLYSAARDDFDRGNYAAAASQLKELLRLTDPSNAPPSMVAVTDLRMLAEGFLTLAESMAASSQTANAAMRPPSGGADAAAKPPALVYTSADREVIAPVEIRRQVPLWEPPPGTPNGTYQGLVEVVINEMGRVESATIRKPIAPTYDAALLLAAEAWRFQPATRDGLPVKFRRSYEVIVHSR